MEKLGQNQKVEVWKIYFWYCNKFQKFIEMGKEKCSSDQSVQEALGRY